MGHFDQYFDLGPTAIPVFPRPIESELNGRGPVELLRTNPSVSAFWDFIHLPPNKAKRLVTELGLGRNSSLTVDRPEDFLYVQPYGGGTASHSLLARVSINDSTRRWIEARQRKLPDTYAALHIRSTDWMNVHVPAEMQDSAYTAFIRDTEKMLTEDIVYVASDNPKIVEIVDEELVSKTIIHEPADFQLEPGKARHRPRHHDSWRSKRSATLLSLFDLFALSNSQEYFFPSYLRTESPKEKARSSGFSLLASFLFENPEIFESLFRIKRSAMVKSLRPISHVVPLRNVEWYRSIKARELSQHQETEPDSS